MVSIQHGPILMASHRRWMALKKESQAKIERFNPTFALFDEHKRFIVTVIVTLVDIRNNINSNNSLSRSAFKHFFPCLTKSNAW